MGDPLDSPHILLRLDLRVHPRDLYSIPSDGHCGYHTLTVLTHPLYPTPPAPPDRVILHRQLLLRLQALADPEIRAAATAGLLHPPPRLLPRAHWFDATWLHCLPDLPPIGCLALHDEMDRSLSPWYYCTTLSGAPSHLEHSLKDLLRVADSGRLMLHTHSHFYPVTPPPFLSLAIRQCSALLQQQLGGTPLPLDFPRPTTQAVPPQVHRYTSIRALPGGIQLGLSQSDLSPEAQWGVFTLKTIKKGSCIMEYGGPLRSQTWLDTPGQNLTYVWSDINNQESLARYAQAPIIIDANPAHTDGWGGRINDGFVQGANVEIRRDKHSTKAHVWALETITPGSELTVHYGPDYWQEHFFSCPDSVQQAAAQCYSLVVVNGKCYQTTELRKLRAQGQAHQSRGVWSLGPRARPTVGPPPSGTTPLPPRPRPPCAPLPFPVPLPASPPLIPGALVSSPAAVLSATPPSPCPSPPPPDPSPLSAREPPTRSMTLPPVPDDPVPFLWLMDLYSSIIEHTVQAAWGVSALSAVANFLHDPANCNMGALLPWASDYGSPARFHLHHAASARLPPASTSSPLALLVADYGMKARSASGLRGDEVDDWPSLTDPADLSVFQQHISLLGTLPHLGPDAQGLISGGLPTADPNDTPPFQAKTALLAIGDPRLPYSLFEPYSPQLDGHASMLPLRFIGDPRLPRGRDHSWNDLLLIGTDPNFALIDPTRGLSPLTVPNPPRVRERIRWALHSLCQATLEAVAAPLPRLCRPHPGPRPDSLPLPGHKSSPRPTRTTPGARPARTGIGTNAQTEPSTWGGRGVFPSALLAALRSAARLPLDTSGGPGHLRHSMELPSLWAQSRGSCRVHHAS